MSYNRKAKEKDDLRKNPDKIDTSMGDWYMREGRVVYLKIHERISSNNDDSEQA